MPGSPDRGPVDQLEQLAQALSDLTAILERTTNAERARLRGLVHEVRAAIEAAMGKLRDLTTARMLPAPEALDAWLHDLRGPGGAMMGWALLLSPERDAATQIRAVEAIERNVNRLLELLGPPPG